MKQNGRAPSSWAVHQQLDNDPLSFALMQLLLV